MGCKLSSFAVPSGKSMIYYIQNLQLLSVDVGTTAGAYAQAWNVPRPRGCRKQYHEEVHFPLVHYEST